MKSWWAELNSSSPPEDDAFEDADGVDDGGDGDPGDLAVLAGGDVVAVVVGDVSATGPQSLYYRAPCPC